MPVSSTQRRNHDVIEVQQGSGAIPSGAIVKGYTSTKSETVYLTIAILCNRPIGSKGWEELSILSVLKKTVVKPVAGKELIGTVKRPP